MDWKIYYAGGETFTGPLEEAPIFGVLVIVEKDQGHGKRFIMGGDYYLLVDGKWLSMDHNSVWHYMNTPGLWKPLLGVMVHEHEWNATVRRARTDPDFPEQTAFYPYESREGTS